MVIYKVPNPKPYHQVNAIPVTFEEFFHGRQDNMTYVFDNMDAKEFEDQLQIGNEKTPEEFKRIVISQNTSAMWTRENGWSAPMTDTEGRKMIQTIVFKDDFNNKILNRD